MKLHDLLTECGITFNKDLVPNRHVARVSADSRELCRDSVFFAFKGSKDDGRIYIDDALNKGCFVVSDSDQNNGSCEMVLKVDNARKLYARMNAILCDHPSKSMRVVGVTGTNGKTTCSYIIHDVLSRGEIGGLVGTVEYRCGKKTYEASHTTPDAARLQSLLKEMRDAGSRFAVMEASSHALDQERLEGIRLDGALFTNWTRDHLDYHKTPQDYLRAKLKIFDLLKDGAYGVLNSDDSSFGEASKYVKNFVSYGLKGSPDFRIGRLKLTLDGSAFEIKHQNESVLFETSLIGQHNVYNILGASALCRMLGISLEESQAVIKKFKGVPGRLERVLGADGFHLFIDYAHTDDGLDNVLKSLKPFVKNRLIVLFGCGGDRDKGKRPRMAYVSEQYADWIMLSSDNPRFEDQMEILDEVKSGFSENFRNFDVEPDRSKAIRAVIRMANEGDVVLLAGKGHEDYQVIGDKKIPFSDKAEALKAISDRMDTNN